ncbi:hypothetical protein ACIBCB_13780 [Streptomyces uncialis]|uniref:hypothetical protein n=1 Tax=Streptomyces uncialis TaxID=1048205 RepID=UPI0037A8ED35
MGEGEGEHAIGAIVYDCLAARVGEVMDREEGVYFLRPVSGGQEWCTRLENLSPATASVRLSDAVAQVNANSRRRI